MKRCSCVQGSSVYGDVSRLVSQPSYSTPGQNEIKKLVVLKRNEIIAVVPNLTGFLGVRLLFRWSKSACQVIFLVVAWYRWQASVSLGMHFSHMLPLALLQQRTLAGVVALPCKFVIAEGMSRIRICTCSTSTCLRASATGVWRGCVDLCVSRRWFLLDWSLLMGGSSSSSELVRCFWPWTWLVLLGKHEVACAGQVLCHLWVWHCSWWPQPEHCNNFCWATWLWMKEHSLAPKYFPGDLPLSTFNIF